MKRSLLLILFVACSFALFGQGSKPSWVESVSREVSYPKSAFYTGFSSEKVANSNNASKVADLLKKDAQKMLLESIRVRMKSETSSAEGSTRVNGKEQLHSGYSQQVQSSAEAEIVGVKTESYYDNSANTAYAFAYANKYELIGYYKSGLSVNVGQIESFVKTAQDLEASGEKPKARQQLETAKPLFAKVRHAQDLLTAVDVNAAAEDLQQAKTESLYNLLTQMQARLAQGVYIFIAGTEKLFEKNENIIANRVKADLAHKGCSFVDSEKEADFRLKIDADVRLSSQSNSLVFCFADVEVELFDIHKQKAVFGDEFSEKSGSSSQEKAGRKAMENAASKVAEKLKSWIQN